MIIMTKQEKVLFDKMLEAGRKKDVAEIEYYIARNDYKAAMDEYNAFCKAQRERKEEIMETIDGFEEFKDKIMYVLDNKDELLELFFCKLERLNYQAREIDRDIEKHGAEFKKEVAANEEANR